MTTLQDSTKQYPQWWVLALFVVTVLSRIPFASQYLYHGDSVNFAFGIRSFNVLEGAPHFPGYIAYVALAQVVNLIFNDPQTTMVVISIVCSGLAAVAMFYLGREMFSAVTGLIAAIFLISSPLVWFYGELALPHAVDLFGITLVLWLLYRIMEGDTRWWWLTAVLMALLGGVRQQDLLFLAPVALLALYRIGIPRLIAFTAIGVVVCLAWFLPLAQNVGGLEQYLEGSSAFSGRFFTPTSVFSGAGTAGLRRNLITKLAPYTLYGLALSIIPLVIYWGLRLPRRWRSWLTMRKFWFVALWITPALAFYILIHMGQQGLTFVFLPALYILSAEGLRRLTAPREAMLRLTTAVIALFGAVVFIFAPSQPLGASGPKILTYATIQAHDRELAAQIHTLETSFELDQTVLLSSNWRFFQYYMPDYALARVNVGENGDLEWSYFTTLAAADYDMDAALPWRIVIVDSLLEKWVHEPDLRHMGATGDGQMGVLDLNPGEVFNWDGELFTVLPQTAQHTS